jgi:hypothetical protein
LFSSALWWSQDVHVIHPSWVIGITVELTFGVIVIITNLWLFVPVIFWLGTIFTFSIIGVVFTAVSFLVVRGA